MVKKAGEAPQKSKVLYHEPTLHRLPTFLALLCKGSSHLNELSLQLFTISCPTLLLNYKASSEDRKRDKVQLSQLSLERTPVPDGFVRLVLISNTGNHATCCACGKSLLH